MALVFLPVLRNPGDFLYSESSDVLSFHLPNRFLLAESLRERGRLPLYNPTAFGGVPFVGDPQAGIGYPPNWLHALSPAGAGEAWVGWSTILHLCLGGVACLWWLGGLGFAPAARLAGALAFVFAGKWFSHLIDAGHVIFLPLVWIPWQCGLIDRIWRDGRLRDCGWLAVVTALAFTGLHPQLLLYSQGVVGAYALAAARAQCGERRTRSALLLAGAAFLALGLAASHLLPSLTSLDLYGRGGGLPYAAASDGSLPLRSLIGFLLPGELSGSWEETVFVGVAALSLACFAPWRSEDRSLTVFFLTTVIFCVVYALGPAGILHRLLFVAVPGFDPLRIPTRILLVMGLPLAYLAAAGMNALYEQPPTRAKRVVAAVLLAAAVAILALYRSGEAAWAAGALALPALCLAAGGPRAHLAWLAALLIFADGARFAAPRVETKPLDEALGVNRFAEAILSPLGRERVLALHREAYLDLSGLASSYATPARLESLRGYNPLVPRAPYRYLLAGVAGKKMDGDPGDGTIPLVGIASRRHLDLFNTRWIISNRRLSVAGLELRRRSKGERVYLGNWNEALARPQFAYLYENPHRLPRAALVRRARLVGGIDAAIDEISRFEPRQEVLVTDPALVGHYPGGFVPVPVEHRGDEIELFVDAGEGGYLLLSETRYPGWRAEDNGKAIPIHGANGIFQLLRLGPGEHHLWFRYLPRAYEVGRWIAIGSLALTGVLLARAGGMHRLGHCAAKSPTRHT